MSPNVPPVTQRSEELVASHGSPLEPPSASNASADAIAVLTEYRRIYEEHWRVTQSARYLAEGGEQQQTHERARALRGENSRIMAEVARQLSIVNIEFSEVSGGVRPQAVDRVIELAIERHRNLADKQQPGAAALDAPRRPPPTWSSFALRTILPLLVAVAIAGGVGMWLLPFGR